MRTDLGHIRLATLSAQQLDFAYTAWLAEGLSPTTVHHIHAVKDLVDVTQDAHPVLAAAIAVAATTGRGCGEICGLR